jgi:protein O-mannosyl-transferase
MKKAESVPAFSPFPELTKKTILRPYFLLASLFLLIAVLVSYSQHYNNPFHFDDDHTIVTNRWVRHLDSFPRFFSDSTTSSSLPANQAYRPGVTILHAIDYQLGLDTASTDVRAQLDSAYKSGGDYGRNELMRTLTKVEPFWFHVHIFIGFLLSGFLLFWILLYLLNLSKADTGWNAWLALFGTGLFWLHTANAETINYVSARSDSASTFWILLTFVLYFWLPKLRMVMLYIIPMIIGFFIKEPTIMFVPLLFFFIWINEGAKGLSKGTNIIQMGIVFIAAIILFLFSRAHTPMHWTSGGTDWLHYLFTSAFVVVHYLLNFILPVNLSADTDWRPVQNLLDDKVMVGAIVIGFLIYLIVRCWKKTAWRPVSFGLIWFFIALAPTTSVFPFAEVLNDHRTYFPYIGLIIALVCLMNNTLPILVQKFRHFTKYALVGASVFLVAHAVGTFNRCTVWSSAYNLWSDCVKKSPENGRAWMHYGMSLFNKGNLTLNKDSTKIWYDSAEVCYNKAKVLMPYYSYLYINWGIMRQWQQRWKEAEEMYRLGQSYNVENPEGYFYLGDFLRIQGRTKEAYDIAVQGLALSPDHERLQGLIRSLAPTNPFQLLNQALDIANKNPSRDNYVNLSLMYYNVSEYQKCIEASQQALSKDSTSAVAWSNICSSYNQLGNYKEAVKAGQNSVRLQENFANGKANLLEALRCLNQEDSLSAALPPKPSADDYLNLSLNYYNQRMYMQCVFAARKTIELRPSDAGAYNNICAAYNQISLYDEAAEAGKKALEIQPNYVLAQNNLNAALNGQKVRKEQQAAIK